jgi:hypothetical protein
MASAMAAEDEMVAADVVVEAIPISAEDAVVETSEDVMEGEEMAAEEMAAEETLLVVAAAIEAARKNSTISETRNVPAAASSIRKLEAKTLVATNHSVVLQ